MVKHECRMTNFKIVIVDQSFVIPASSFFRASSFVIRHF